MKVCPEDLLRLMNAECDTINNNGGIHMTIEQFVKTEIDAIVKMIDGRIKNRGIIDREDSKILLNRLRNSRDKIIARIKEDLV